MMKNKFMKYFKSQSKNKRIIMSIGFVLLIALVIYIPFSLAVLTPIKSITITSEHTNYETKEEGSWQVKKSAVWKKKGEAEITFDVDTVMKTNNEATDVILVLDVSALMSGDKLNRVKNDTTELVNSLLSDSKNRVALITFETKSTLVSGLTNNKEELTNKINSLVTGYRTNYYQALVNVNNILKDYQKEEKRECIVLFLIGSYPNEDIPNQNTYFDYLKDNYPYINVHAIQYEMGNYLLEPIKRISDNQYLADMNTLNNVLSDASVAPLKYKDFLITDYINTDYFYVESSSDISSSQGSIDFDKENQKFTWNIDGLKSGTKASITINAKLKEELIDKGGVYPTNKQEEIKSIIAEENEDVVSKDTPILADNYKVIYDGNAPDGCSVAGVPNEEDYFVFDIIKISDSKPQCEGYQFKGWKVVTKSTKKINDNHFIMPEENVTIRATWSKLTISKSMKGEVYTVPTLYKLMTSNVKSTDASIDFSVAPTKETSGIYQVESTKNDEYPVYYYRGIIDNNNVSFAGFCWKIVRTTSTGGVKLIYNGVVGEDGSCNNTGISTQIATEQFNSGMRSASDNGYMHGINYDFSFRGNFSGAGYVYGNDVKWDGTKYTLVNTMTSSSWSSDRITIGTSYHYTCLNNSNTCTTVYYVNYVGFTDEINYLILSDGKNIDDARNEMFSNEIDSNIKTKIDEWYSNNMLEYSDMLEDTIWCNDRSIYEGTLKGKDSPSSGKSTNIFGPFGRIGYNNSYNPIITCPNKNDSFTVSSESGNGALKYPIALLTIDELVLSGLQAKSYNTSSYLFSDTDWFTMSPRADFHTTVFAASQKNWQYASYISGVRPSISIVSGTMIADGNGSVTNPYKLSNHS